MFIMYNILDNLNKMIKEKVQIIKQRISLACSRTTQDASKITIVAVSKGRNFDQIKDVVEAGIIDIGENKVQEARFKYNTIRAGLYSLGRIKWHMVGHLQTNKAKEAVGMFDLIHSVDSLHLLAEIDKQARKISKIQDILIQVNLLNEQDKFGFKPEEMLEITEGTNKFKNLSIKGLMTIAPVVDDPQETSSYFRMLREIRDKINRLTNCRLNILSMGMTDDFEVAIEEGANMIRLGRAIFD